VNTVKFTAGGKEAALYTAASSDCPLIVFNSFEGAAEAVVKELENLTDREFNFLCVSRIDWNHDMSPWNCPALFPNEPPFTGGADEYLELLTGEIIPQALKLIAGQPSHISITGYSLAGLFALYAMYRTDVFARAASMSGSLWFPDFRDFACCNQMKAHPDKLYFSLGDREARTRNPLMRTVQDNTEFLVSHFKEMGIDVTWELNPGNHFRDADIRSAKGIAAII